ncbi:hypothetical protein FK492_20545 [Pantoea dispersa]|uniref:Rho operon leader peptide n=1 Tax=Pantoea dispersa TaxID=59814 RepID=A0ABY2ZU80_9GAMM|nr:hypothetical protein FK492_20545 [Pantoea dispersa]
MIQDGFYSRFFSFFYRIARLRLPFLSVSFRKRALSPGVLSAVMLRTEPASRLCPAPFRGSGFPS